MKRKINCFWLLSLLSFGGLFLNPIITVKSIASSSIQASPKIPNIKPNYPVLVYHKFDLIPKDSMTVSIDVFKKQLQWLQDNHYQVMPLKNLVNFLLGKGPEPSANAVFITVDDGNISQYTQMYPIILKYKVPVTLFVYPAGISHKPESKKALTWDELKEMQKSNLVDIQDHTYTHPNFRHYKKFLTPEAYQQFIDMQLASSKQILEENLSTKVDYLAWPYGIYNNQLEQSAKNAGYSAAFTIDYRRSSKAFDMMSQPRYMIFNKYGTDKFVFIINGHRQLKK